MNLEITTSTPDETLALGRRFAAILTAGDIVALSGRLGAGKTLFVGGVAEGLGIPQRITSPSFVISRMYNDGFLPLVHADVYRLGSIGEFDDLELTDEGGNGVLMIEWGDSVQEALGPDYILIRIDIEGDDRTFTFTPSGSWSSRDLELLR
jgi:tRNA threonylcarbamoyladenosine biosynthesis protein TsaE